MNHVLTGAAVVAALTIAAPAWPHDPIGATPPPLSGKAPAAFALPVSESDAGSAAQHPNARPRHATRSSKASQAHGQGARANAGDIANQLNQQELSRAQAGNLPSQPPSGPSAAMPSGPSSSARMPGPKSSAGGYIQPQPGAGTTPPQPSPSGIGAIQGGPR